MMWFVIIKKYFFNWYSNGANYEEKRLTKGVIMRKLFCLIFILILALCACSSKGTTESSTVEPQEELRNNSNPSNETNSTAPSDSAGYNWLITTSDTKKTTLNVPSTGKSIDITVTLYFVAWKNGGEDMFGKYEGRALITFDGDLSKLSSGSLSFTGGFMDDNICENIFFEMMPYNQEAIKVDGSEDIDLAPLAKFVGQSDFVTDEYLINQQTWQALADGEVKLDVNSSFSDGEKYPQGFSLKADESTVIVSVPTFTQTYNLDYFKGEIIKTTDEIKPVEWFRDTVMTRMEERLAMGEQSQGESTEPDAGDDSQELPQGSFITDSEGREGFDMDGDGKLDIWFDDEGNVWSDFDKDGNFEPIPEGTFSDGALN
jgi:hypothetical protein